MKVQKLGQAGFRFECMGTVVFVDPYLSDRVEMLEGPKFRRLIPAPFQAIDVKDASYVLISHIHNDHCDVDTLLPIARASSRCRFIGPRDVVRLLEAEGIDSERLITANTDPIDLGHGLVVKPVQVAHKMMERDFAGFYRFLGYVICFGQKRYLHTGDTCVHECLIKQVKSLGPIDVAFLPVNECNFFRDQVGIIGNMSIREAFLFAEQVSARKVVPMHFDMFAPNSAFREEIEVVYNKISPPFELDFDPIEV